jgi:PKHD-type hydroxylase
MSVPALNRMWSVFHDKMKEHNDNIWKFHLDILNEQAQYARYEVGGHFGWHMDLGKEGMSVRKLSAVIMLSDPSEYDGGMLQMFNQIDVPLGKGDAIFFPSFMLHRVTPVTRGVRRSTVLWAGGKFYS